MREVSQSSEYSIFDILTDIMLYIRVYLVEVKQQEVYWTPSCEAFKPRS